MTYGAISKCIFSLVEKDCNFTQLRNQIKNMRLNENIK
jgi:hypothetical protein